MLSNFQAVADGLRVYGRSQIKPLTLKGVTLDGDADFCHCPGFVIGAVKTVWCAMDEMRGDWI
jgi:hypothetical protein